MEVSVRVCEGVEVGVSEIEGERLVGVGVGVRVRVGVRVQVRWRVHGSEGSCQSVSDK